MREHLLLTTKIVVEGLTLEENKSASEDQGSYARSSRIRNDLTRIPEESSWRISESRPLYKGFLPSCIREVETIAVAVAQRGALFWVSRTQGMMTQVWASSSNSTLVSNDKTT